MFTGIIKDTGIIKSVAKKDKSAKITIQTDADISTIDVGGSISVDGVCLTVVALNDRHFTADVSHETIRATTFGECRSGRRVNLELPLTLSSPLGGHLVTGHIDGIGTIKDKRNESGFFRFNVEFPESLSRYIVKKGSVSVDGVSLTVVESSANSFTVFLIPHTLSNTTLTGKRIGDRVNIEADILVRYVEGCMHKGQGAGITRDLLIKHLIIDGKDS